MQSTDQTTSRDQLIRIANLKYKQGLNNAQIAEALQLDVTVIDYLLNEARRQGVVEIRIQQTGDIRDDLAAITHELFEAELITSTGGNVSVRVPDHPDQIWMTPSKKYKGTLTPDDMSRVDLDGNLIDQDALPISIEWRIHCSIYRARPDILAVVHTHPPQAIIMAMTDPRFLPVSAEAAFIGSIESAPFVMPGTQDLADAVVEALGDNVGALMINHGLVTGAKNLRTAADYAYIVEQSAITINACRLLGQEPPVLPEEACKNLNEMRITGVMNV